MLRKTIRACLATIALSCGGRLARAAEAPPKRPNILFAIADDATWSSFSAYGCRYVNTPNFDRIAREGALFNNCFTPLPKCSPSRASILSGKNPWQLEEACDHFGIFPAKFAVYPDLLESSGYFVGFTGKGWGPGDWKKGGFTRNPAGPQFAEVKLTPPTTGINALDYAGNFAAFLKARPAGKPFCFWYGGFEPHRPYEKGSGIKVGKKLEDAIVPPYLPDDPIIRSDLLDYAREIEWFDEQLGKMLKQLDDAGELDNTLVIVTADNGMPFPRVKGHIYEDAFHLPLAIRWAGVIKPGRVIEDFISFIDLAPTYMEIAGVTPPQPMTGRSFLGVLKSQASGQIDPTRDHVLIGREREDLGRPGDVGYPVRAIRTSRFLYARNFTPDRWPCGSPETGYPDTDESPTKSLVIQLKDQGQPLFYNLAMAKRGAEELYDLRSDPACVHNVADKPQFADMKTHLWDEMKTELTNQQDPRILGRGEIFDHYENTNNRKRAWDTVMGTEKPNEVTMQISALDIAVVVIYLMAALGLGVYQARKIRTSGDYYAGGRKFNKFYLMMHALGTASHADEPVSVIGGAYQKGLAGIWYTYIYLPLTPIFWLLAPFIRRTRFVTTADFFRVRYDQSLAMLYAVIGVLKMSVSIGLVLKSTATVFNSVTGNAPGNRTELYAILAMTVVFVTYGFAGGLGATVITETIQGPLIVLMSLLLLPFGLYQVGGFKALHQALPASMFQLRSASYEFTPQWVIAASITALIGWVAQPGIVAAVGSGKTELEGRVGYTYGTMIKRFCAMGWVFTGIILAAMAARQQLSPAQVQSLQGKGRELAFGLAIRSFFPTGLLGLTFAAIFAAQMATLSAQMVNSSALAARNIYKAGIHPNASDRQLLVFGRVCGIFLVVIGVCLALMLAKVADALTMLLQFSAIMGVVVWAGVSWRRANTAGAWAAVIVLFISWVLWGPVGGMIRAGVGGPAWLGRYGPAEYVFELSLCYLPAGVLTLIIVSRLTKPQPKKQLDDFFLLLKTPVGQEQKLIDAGVKMIYAGNTIASPLETTHPRLVHWGGFALAALICIFILGLLMLLAWIGS